MEGLAGTDPQQLLIALSLCLFPDISHSDLEVDSDFQIQTTGNIGDSKISTFGRE
jgi:hypothetical protein